ncbi:MAG TPA: glycosyltransferase [Xanthobacteraceae bacterium]|nr:glycosyltransferase [Xanthobacteraceae bacterium]
MPPAPHITVVTSRLDVGGTERHLTRILPALRRRGLDINLYVMERGGALESEISTRGVRVEGPRRARLLHWPRATLALTRFLRRERPDIVHFFLPRPYIYGSIAAELAGHRRRIMSRRSLAHYMTRYPLSRALERLLHTRCIALVGNSRAIVDQLATECGEPRKLVLIHNGVEVQGSVTAAQRQEVRRRLQISDAAMVMAVVANLIPYKGHRDLIEALAIAKDAMPARWLLLVIGRDDGIGPELKALADALGIAGNIIWYGEQSAVDDFLRASDIFILPSHEEGFSNALLEAMETELAVIATAVGGNVDAVVDEESGLLVRANHPRALAAAILRLANDPALRHRFAQAARHRVQQHYSLDTCVDNYEKLYRGASELALRALDEMSADGPVKPSAHATLPASARPR